MNKVPYRNVLKLSFFMPLDNNNVAFSKAYCNHTKPNTKPEIVNQTNYFVINLELNILYPPLDGFVNCFDCTKFSTTFPVRSSPIPLPLPVLLQASTQQTSNVRTAGQK